MLSTLIVLGVNVVSPAIGTAIGTVIGSYIYDKYLKR